MAIRRQPRRSICIIDDDLGTRETLRDLLVLAGYPAQCHANGQEALDHLATAPLPGLILLNLMMPVMNGWVFRDHQRQDPLLSPIPVVLISAVTDLANQAGALGTVGYLSKPIDIDRLMQLVARYCG